MEKISSLEFQEISKLFELILRVRNIINFGLLGGPFVKADQFQLDWIIYYQGAGCNGGGIDALILLSILIIVLSQSNYHQCWYN